MWIVDLTKIAEAPNRKIEVYNNINRIPLDITIGNYPNIPNTIYCENSSGENFIEFRFDKESKNLFEITLVAIQSDTVLRKVLSEQIKKDEFYICKISEENSLLKGTLPMMIEKDKSSICIRFFEETDSLIIYFSIAENCFIGIDNNNYLKSILINGLSEKDIKEIFGF